MSQISHNRDKYINIVNAVIVTYFTTYKARATRCVCQCIYPELIHPSWGSSTYSALTRMGSKLKTDTVLNDETSEIERDLCAFGPIVGGRAAASIQ